MFSEFVKNRCGENERCSRDSEQIKFLRSDFFRLFLLGFLSGTDEFTEFAGMFSAEGGHDRLLKALLLGEANDHVEPRDGLEQRPVQADGKHQHHRDQSIFDPAQVIAQHYSPVPACSSTAFGRFALFIA